MRRRRRRTSRSGVGFFVIIALFLLLLTQSSAKWLPSAALLLLIIVVLIAGWRLGSAWVRSQRFRMLGLDNVDAMAGHEFEHYVARLLQQQGFATTVTKGSNDMGVDIVARGRDAIYAVQCKRYSGHVPRTAISDAVAGKQHYRCTHAMVVTNSYFSAGAMELAKSTQCVLIDRNQLTSWIHDFHKLRP
jgi:restriction system protein